MLPFPLPFYFVNSLRSLSLLVKIKELKNKEHFSSVRVSGSESRVPGSESGSVALSWGSLALSWGSLALRQP